MEHDTFKQQVLDLLSSDPEDISIDYESLKALNDHADSCTECRNLLNDYLTIDYAIEESIRGSAAEELPQEIKDRTAAVLAKKAKQYLGSEDPEKGIQYYQEILRLTPGDKEATDRLNNLIHTSTLILLDGEPQTKKMVRGRLIASIPKAGKLLVKHGKRILLDKTLEEVGMLTSDVATSLPSKTKGPADTYKIDPFIIELSREQESTKVIVRIQ